MATLLFPDFLGDESQYAAVERFWQALFDELAREVRQTGQWRSWRPRTYANGMPLERDGNPVFDAMNEVLGKAVQVIQWPTETGEVEITAWVSDIPRSTGSPVQELTVNLSLSTEAAEISKQLIRLWLTERVTDEEIRGIVERARDKMI